MSKRTIFIGIGSLCAVFVVVLLLAKKTGPLKTVISVPNQPSETALEKYRENVKDVQIGRISGGVYYMSLSNKIQLDKTTNLTDVNNFTPLSVVFDSVPVHVEISPSEKYVLSEEKEGESQPNRLTVYDASGVQKKLTISNAFEAHWLAGDRLIFVSRDPATNYQLKTSARDFSGQAIVSSYQNPISAIDVSSDQSKAIITSLTGGGDDTPSSQSIAVYDEKTQVFSPLPNIPLITDAHWSDNDNLLLKQATSNDENPSTQVAVVDIAGKVKQGLPIEGDLTQAIRINDDVFYASSTGISDPEGIASYSLLNHLVIDWIKPGTTPLVSIDQIIAVPSKNMVLIVSKSNLYAFSYSK